MPNIYGYDSDDSFIDDRELYEDEENEDIPIKVQNWIQYQKLNNDSDDKLQSKINFLITYPWNKTHKFPINLNSSKKTKIKFWKNVKNIMDTNVSCMENACQEIVNILARNIANPNSKRKPILITGVPGVAKTRLVSKVLGSALGLPIEYINLSGYTREDLTVLKGSSGVWQGSSPSIIIQAIHKAQSNNLIVIFDEFDKIFDVQVYHFFNQLFDDSSTIFRDQFIENLEFDISKVNFVCITNNNQMIPEPLMNRLENKIYIKAPNNVKKITICQKHIIPDILNGFNIKKNDIIFSDQIISYIINKKNISNNEGLRSLHNAIDSIVKKINTIRVQMNTNIFLNPWYFNVKFPLYINEKIVDDLL